MIKKLILLFNTIKYLKYQQIFFRLFYLVRSKYRRIIGFNYPLVKDSKVMSLNLINSIDSYKSYDGIEFNFLNLVKSFDSKIDWNYNGFGKLWVYNLTYFDYLNQKTLDNQTGIKLIHDFIDNQNIIKDGFDPFPISLRGINWIKFLTYKKINDKKINDSLYAQYYMLIDNLEYHLLGNHLLENAFSILFGAYYFHDDILYQKAKILLNKELEEQILNDGGHFELSPMYHQIMLYRVLDCINLVKNNNYKNQELLDFLISKASLMLGWLKNIGYRNGDIPLFNDSANNIAPTSFELFGYAKTLELEVSDILLKDSGYRKIVKTNYEVVVDVGNIGAEYIPGHAHADTFNFELRVNSKPFIVDTGISTYETNAIRYFQRSTSAHNTVEIFETDSSEVWSGFRVANRAFIIQLIEKEGDIESSHNGYKKYEIVHNRIWKFKNNQIIIEDSLSRNQDAVSRLHFHPDITEEDILKYIKIPNSKFQILDYMYADGFNKLQSAKYMEIAFNTNTKVEINI